MKKSFFFLSTLCLILCGFTQTRAQTPHPPPVLVIEHEAMGKDGREEMDKITDRSVLFSETSYYAVNPGLSIVSPEFAATDPAFWNQKPPAPPTPRRK